MFLGCFSGCFSGCFGCFLRSYFRGERRPFYHFQHRLHSALSLPKRFLLSAQKPNRANCISGDSAEKSGSISSRQSQSASCKTKAACPLEVFSPFLCSFDILQSCQPSASPSFHSFLALTVKNILNQFSACLWFAKRRYAIITSAPR